jgi:hypothetical protein
LTKIEYYEKMTFWEVICVKPCELTKCFRFKPINLQVKLINLVDYCA